MSLFAVRTFHRRRDDGKRQLIGFSMSQWNPLVPVMNGVGETDATAKKNPIFTWCSISYSSKVFLVVVIHMHRYKQRTVCGFRSHHGPHFRREKCLDGQVEIGTHGCLLVLVDGTTNSLDQPRQQRHLHFLCVLLGETRRCVWSPAHNYSLCTHFGRDWPSQG